MGSYAGGDAKSIRQKADDGGIVINFKGDAVFFSEIDANSPGVSKSIIMNAQVGPQEGHATAILKDKELKGSNYQMVAHAPPGNAKYTESMVEAALESGDWAALCALTSSTLTSAMTLEEFVADLSAQEDAVGRVVVVDLLSEPDIQFSPHGMWFFTVRNLVTFDINGTFEEEEFVDYYLLEGDA